MKHRRILGAYGVAVGMLKLKGDEIQSDSLQEIAEKSVHKRLQKERFAHLCGRRRLIHRCT